MSSHNQSSTMSIFCSKCGNKQSANARFCSNCAQPIRQFNDDYEVSDGQEYKKVGLLLGLGIFLMPYIFAWLTLQQGYSSRAKTISFIWLSFFGFSLLVSNVFKNNNSPVIRTGETGYVSQSQSVAPTIEPKSANVESINPNALANFEEKVMNIPAGRQLINRVEQGVSSTVLNIYVNNIFLEGEKYQRRQLTTQFVNLWKMETGSRNVIVHIYDLTGHEVAGTKFLGGVWVEE